MTPIKTLRYIGLLEGLSYLFLLGVAMPLKYLAHQPLAVQITGSLHGLFFLLFCASLLQVWLRYKLTLWQAGLAFLSSLLPFGTFVLDRKLKAYEAQLAPETA